MAQTNSSLQRWEPIVLSILRIVIGLLILQHGTQKIFHFPPPDKPMGSLGELPPLVLVAGLLELIGGLLLVLGFFTRPAAFILCGLMAVAYFMAHASGSLYPIKNHGELAVVYCFICLYLTFSGGGRWSVDAMRRG
ncbi:MAG: DoxX family protein [Chthoniobacterales bacterium]